MNIKALKYLSPLVVYILSYLAFTFTGLITWSALFYAFVFLPLVELFMKPNTQNFTEVEEEMAKKDKVYDYILYCFVVLQFVTLWIFLNSVKNDSLQWWEIIGRVWTMGVICGVFGINIGHELGHRVNKFEQTLAKASLLTSLYMHFFIEHNKGHHKNVATREDPSSSRYNESVYAFYFRSIIFSYFSAWKIANADMKKKGLPIIHWKNEMIIAHFIQIAFVAIIFIYFGPLITLYYLIAAGLGIGLLETVNYITHYGLQRKKIADEKYERAMPWHSWNSDYVLGRLMLFELSRHSDHHYLASRKYQVLQHHDNTPQLPTGYPGSLILACVPPAWFYVMNKKIKELEKNLK